ncbi:RagB/SusD family nutrient uptake outer membrane protein [Botryobacter ruber]|uniref:RagB/SusD family nutrient uptake outer membrane protein n=1 Tax=Botryobacter ruber TaxID=2171629 RepID=UPI000E0B4FC8|nr:RagB/SusD family nutrient uptake outer membrane protein [Botryobacter ruber]
MKKFLKSIAIALPVVLMATTGCKDFLDREPLSELSPGTFFGTKGDMATWMAGMYDETQTTLMGSQIGALEWGDLRSDNYNTTGYGDTRVYMNAIDASQSQYNWENLYRVIDRSNVAIARFPKIPNLTSFDYNDNLGQSYGMRALMYFYAIRVWGEVPLITEPWDGSIAKSQLGRAPMEEIKKQIQSDIDKAITLLSTNVTANRKFVFNLGAAYALKTDVHMWFKEYDKAILASNYFIGNSNYALVTNSAEWKDMFLNPTTSNETIFTLNWSDDLIDGTNSWAQRVGASNTNNGYQVSKVIFDEFVTRLRSGQGKDGRFWNVLDTLRMSASTGGTVPIGYNHYFPSSTYSDGITKNHKFSSPSTDPARMWQALSTTLSFVKLPVYRLADVLTLRAEALNQVNRGDEALTIVNNIRKRVGYMADAKAEVSTTDKAAIENLILKERQLEFMAEGKRWFDLLRTDKVMEVMDPVMRQRQEAANVVPIGFGDPRRAKFPIYYKEFEANPALKGKQNPPYTEG